MSCGCNEFDADNPNGNTSCGPCNPCTSESAECESLPSALDNFTTHFFGTVSKTLVNGKVQWVLPCNLDSGLPDNPRNDGEGLACYFLRLFLDGIIGLTGPKGNKGDPGEDGLAGYTITVSDLTIPTGECPVAQVTVEDADVIPEGAYIFVSGGGWFSIVSRSGNTLQLQLIEAVVTSGTVISSGALVALTGPEGPQGTQGPKGNKGDKGDKGNTGSPGDDGDDGAAALTTTLALFVQPAVGASVVVSVDDSTLFAGGQQAYVVTGGYYDVTAVVPGSITLRNLGIAATNAAPAANIGAGARVMVVGSGPVSSASQVLAEGATDPTVTNAAAEITFDTVALEVTLPSAGTYLVTAQVTLEADNPAPLWVYVQLYNNTAASVVGHRAYANLGSHVGVFHTADISAFVTVGAASVIRVWGETDANTASAVSEQCSIHWIRINPVA